VALPLDGVLVIDFSQFLAGPYASLRLMDLGARVIKVENPDGGDLCRSLYLSDTSIGGDSTLFHAINRGKESIALDLKSDQGLAAAGQLAKRADVMIQNFRPGVIERLGLGYDDVRKTNPDVIYGSISGYGSQGEWADLPGQDLLAQARSGIMWLSGNADHDPVPLGIPIADISAGANLAQGILAALFRHAKTGEGGLVETSLLESLLDLQFEFLSTFLGNGGRQPQRMERGSAHGYLSAPYGIYPTQQGYLALAMTPLHRLAAILECSELNSSGKKPWKVEEKERIHGLLSRLFLSKQAAEWESFLTSQGVWCAEVLDWERVLATQAVKRLKMIPDRGSSTNKACNIALPIRLDGNRAQAGSVSPRLNEDAEKIRTEFLLG
jgi:CoA:oxalate CoA-transferase